LDPKKWFFLGEDKSLIYELILALVSLWLLVNLIKKETPKKNVRLIFLIILLKNIFLIIIILFCLFLVLNVVTA